MSLSLNGTDGVTFNDGSEQWAAASPIGTKNLIINGNMQIAQRGTSASGLVNYANYNTLDRWKFATNIGTWTMSQDSDIPSNQGFVKSLKLACTTVDTTLGATDYCFVEQKIEAQNLQHLKFGTSSAETLTLSFWIKSNKTGIVNTELRQDDATRSISRAATINAADTWEKKTFIIEGDTSGVINNDNGQGFRLLFHLDAGSDYTSTALQTTWDTDIPAGSAYNNVNLADSTSNYINITGVQLEVGDTATPFEHRPYDMELARCQRYYVKYTASSGGATYAYSNAQNGGAFWQSIIYLPTTMRTTPSLSSSGTFSFHINGLSTRDVSSVGISSNITNGNVVRISGSKTSGDTTGLMGQLMQRSGSSGYIDFSAEL